MSIILKHKPLVEAIFEIRWELQKGPEKGMQIDPHYKLLIGRIYEKIKNEYPYYEQLPTASMPDEIAEYIIQHRFRKSINQWPLIQLGPGIISLNETHNYTWSDFEKKANNLIKILFELYPEAEKNLKINSVLLRYIDSMSFNFEKINVFDFIKDKMKMCVEINATLFKGTGVSRSPYGFDLKFTFPSKKPLGAIHLRFTRGEKKNKDQLAWETHVHSLGADAPISKKDISDWIKDAHVLADDWFFKIIEGELRRRFE